MLEFAKDRAVSRVSSAVNLSSMDGDGVDLLLPAPGHMPRSKSLTAVSSLGTILEENASDTSSEGTEAKAGGAPLSRKPSELALAELAQTHALCEGCLSKCASSSSLSRLDEEFGGGGGGGGGGSSSEDESGGTTVFSTGGSSVASAFSSSPSSSSSSRGFLLGSHCHTECGRCEVCTAASTSWATLVRRALTVSLGASLGYLLWLRFIASKETVRRHLFAMVRVLGERIFQYRVKGAEHIPTSGPALLCCYHGFIPLDMYFYHEHIHRVTGRLPTTLVADFVFQIPLFSYFVRCCGGVPARRDAALKALQAGGLVMVAPGGVREAMTSSAEDYLIRWFGRTGFAETARLTGAPIVPMFTKGIREVFLVLGGSNPLVQWLYKLTRLPFTPFLGPLPVPLTSVIGAPLQHGGALSKDVLAERVRLAMAALMMQQRRRLVNAGG